MDAKEFIEVARRLHGSEHEADRRTSLSRAYYGVFNHVSGVLFGGGISLPKSAGAHGKAHRYLLNSGVEEAEELAEELDNLRKVRNDADYDLTNPRILPNRKNCSLYLLKAIQFIEQLDDIDSARLLRGIKDHMRAVNEL